MGSSALCVWAVVSLYLALVYVFFSLLHDRANDCHSHFDYKKQFKMLLVHCCETVDQLITLSLVYVASSDSDLFMGFPGAYKALSPFQTF